MKKYRVHTEMDVSKEFETLVQAEKIYERWKDDLMSEGVQANESFVEIAESDDGFEDYKVVKKVIAVIDNDRTELRTPREEGCDWDYWAKWQEVDGQL
ncbi:hypothetical protein [Paenibacillus rigui]|uniref:Uncharacterized protein n=1 Tax=Paenibacillus rigui TaxID=554312 RepID=A0A229UKT3_9BACL|nr:hypothetical protein [Paenibacillus rigui]OXM83992.1 hypothetical protein CF651_23050 [Paenibacillus rigui]